MKGRCSEVAGSEKEHPKGILGKVPDMATMVANKIKRDLQALRSDLYWFPLGFLALGTDLFAPASRLSVLQGSVPQCLLPILIWIRHGKRAEPSAVYLLWSCVDSSYLPGRYRTPHAKLE